MSSITERLVGAPQPWRVTLSGWLTLARISNSPTVVSDVLAGAALAGRLGPSQATVLLAGAMLLFYTAGMILNDVCDFTWDRHYRPDRPLPSGAVSRGAAAGAVVVLLGAGSLLLWLAGPRPFASGLALIGLIGVYDRWHKDNPISPLLMAGCRLLVYVTAFVAFAWPLSPALVAGGTLLTVYLVGLTAIAKSETRPRVVGYWPAALVFLPPVYFLFQMPTPALLALPVLTAAWVAYSLTFVYQPRRRSIGGAIARLIAGISLVDALVLASAGAAGGIAVAAAAFGLTLLFQRYVEGT